MSQIRRRMAETMNYEPITNEQFNQIIQINYLTTHHELWTNYNETPSPTAYPA